MPLKRCEEGAAAAARHAAEEAVHEQRGPPTAPPAPNNSPGAIAAPLLPLRVGAALPLVQLLALREPLTLGEPLPQNTLVMPAARRRSRLLSAPETAARAPSPPPPTDVWFGSFSSPAERFIRTQLGPLFLLLVTPLFVQFAALAALKHDSSLPLLFSAYRSPAAALAAAFPLPSARLALCFFAFVAFQAALLVALPGRVFSGAVAPSGFVPSFRANARAHGAV
jgi:hypothetical protein